VRPSFGLYALNPHKSYNLAGIAVEASSRAYKAFASHRQGKLPLKG